MRVTSQEEQVLQKKLYFNLIPVQRSIFKPIDNILTPLTETRRTHH